MPAPRPPDRARGRRRQTDPHRRRRLRHPAGRTRAGADPSRHLEDCLAGRPRTGRHDGLSRRGAGLDRRRRPRHADQPRAGRCARLAPAGRAPAAPEPAALVAGTVVEMPTSTSTRRRAGEILKSEHRIRALRRGRQAHRAGLARGGDQLTTTARVAHPRAPISAPRRGDLGDDF